jgi:CYTH domain-containing protein
MSKEIEIERKFVLSDIPFDIDRELKLKSVISQFYIEDDKNPEKTFRVRVTSFKGKTTYVRTIKTPIKDRDSIGQYEDEIFISEDEFVKFIEKSNKKITKTRFVSYIDGNKWEFDVFYDLDLIMCELEMIADNVDEVEEVENKLNNVSIPESIQKVLIKEVTGEKEYSNRSMAVPYKHKEV